jgi:ATP-dependent Clp protease ATP-binding subunit ClpC
VTEQDIANIVAQWTGIPIEKVSADETERLIKMEEVLHGRVIGQVSHRCPWSTPSAHYL